MTDAARYRVAELIGFATALFTAGGLEADKSTIVAELLVEADALGHTTHGLYLAPAYLDELDSGAMAASGEPAVLADRGAAVTWDGKTLPGIWLTARAVDLAVERAARHGIAAVVIRRSHHIGCLAAFLRRGTDRGCLTIVTSSDPADASVAPFGGRRAVFTPDPLAVGIPTDGNPILIDISASITTNGMSARLAREGARYPGQWALDAEGYASDDPAVLSTNPPGTLLPVGGLDHGHKGYGLALLVEALTQGLAGFGRANVPTGWGASVFVQAIDPAAFGGAGAFTRQTGWIADACRTTPARPGVDAVRLPGERALAHRRAALDSGLALYPGIMPGLAAWADRLGVLPPRPIGGG
jgi:LDH2 family malate/lactate/ureidoglycolate dehydrogenase